MRRETHAAVVRVAPVLLILSLLACTTTTPPQAPSSASTPEDSPLPGSATSQPPPPPIQSTPPPAPPPVETTVPTPKPEAVSLAGKPLMPLALPPEVQKKREEELAAARSEYDKDPASANAMIWVGRRLGYLGRFREAIEVFSKGIEKFPRDARFYRHRGHRYITVREFGHAIADLTEGMRLAKGKKDEIEPDGLPNRRNIPTTTLKSNLCYHLGLAHYLRGDFERALRTYRPCLKVSNSPDRLVSVSHWLYMTLRRLGREKEAAAALDPIGMDMDVIENIAYHKLLLMYAGEIDPEELLRERGADSEPATIGYGVGNWYLYNGQTSKALQTFRRVADGARWDSFGYIAAEAELARK